MAGLINMMVGVVTALFGAGLLVVIHRMGASLGSLSGIGAAIAISMIALAVWQLLFGGYLVLRPAFVPAKGNAKGLTDSRWLTSTEGRAIGAAVILVAAVAWYIGPNSWKASGPVPLRSWRALTGDAGSIGAMAFSPDGQWLVTAGNGSSKLWALDGGRGDLLPQVASAIAFSPDGHRLAAVTDAGLRIWASPDWAVVRPSLIAQSTMASYKGSRYAHDDGIAFSPDGKSVAAGSSAEGLFVFDAENGKVEWSHPKPADVEAVAYSRDGRMIAAAEGKGDVMLWDAASGALLRDIPVATMSGVARALAFFRDGRLAVGSDSRQGIMIFDGATGRLLQTLLGSSSSFRPGGGVWSIAISPDGNLIAAGEGDHSIRIWKKGRDRAERTVFGHSDKVVAVAFSPDGRQLASGSADGMVKFWPAVK